MFEVERVRGGQVGTYQDSVYIYKVRSDLPMDEVKQRCLDELGPVNPKNEKPGHTHNGACGFPFGLDAFYTFMNTGENEYKHQVTCPFTG